MVRRWWVARLDREPTEVDTPVCVSCGVPPTDRGPVGALPNVTAPYCAICLARARRFSDWRAPAVIIGVAGLLGLVSLFIPFTTWDVASLLALALAFVGSTAAVVVLSARTEPDGGSEGPAVRAHKIRPVVEIDCWRRDVADALVASFGGGVSRTRVLRGRVALATVPLATAMAGMGICGAVSLFTSTLEVDNAGKATVVVSVDGRVEARVAPGAHVAVVVRHGHRVIRWSLGAESRERVIDVGRAHDYLLSPGPRACYWKEVGVYRPEYAHKLPLTSDQASAVSGAGPLPIDELQTLPHVAHWFESMPAQKQDNGSSIDIGIARDEECTDLLQRGCTSAVAVDLLRCEANGGQRRTCADSIGAQCLR